MRLFKRDGKPAWEGLDLTTDDVDDFMVSAATSGREQVPLAIAAQVASEITQRLCRATQATALELARAQGGLMAIRDFCETYRRGLENAKQRASRKREVRAGANP